MKKVRLSAFETNSSSTHSITIAFGDYAADSLTVEDGVCSIYTGEFGWGVDVFRDAQTKAAYCLTWLMNECGHRKDEFVDLFREVIMDNTGAKEVQFVPEYTEKTKTEWDWHQWGYIDHQSSDVCLEAFRDREHLERFIFHPKSTLVIDNDNH